MKKLFLILVILFFASNAWSADQNIYLDNAGAGAGSEGDPYGAFAEINWTTGGANSIFDWVDGGDDVYINLKKGVTWQEQLTIGTDGAIDHPITIRAYGDGADPIISGADDVIGVGGDWTEQGDGVWRKNIGAVDPDKVVIFNGSTLGIKDAAPAAEYEWAYANPNLDVYTAAGDNNPAAYYTSIEAAQRSFCINVDDSYITISGISLFASENDALHLACDGDLNIIIDNLTINFAGNNGILASQIDTLTVQDCTVNYSYNNGIYIEGSAANAITNTTITRNTVAHTTTNDGITIHKDGALNDAGANHVISYNSITGTTEEGIDITSGSNIDLIGNYTTANVVSGIVVDNGITGVVIAFHYSKDDGAAGIYIHGATSPIIHSCTIETPTSYCIDIGAGGTVDDIAIYNCTLIADSRQPIRIGGVGVDGVVVKNMIFYSSDETKALIIYTGANSDDSNSDFNYNRYYRTDNDDGQDLWEGGTWAEWQAGAQDTNSSFGDPLFTDGAGGDFTLKRGSPCIGAGTVPSGFETIFPLDPKKTIIDPWTPVVAVSDYGSREIGAYVFLPYLRGPFSLGLGMTFD